MSDSGYINSNLALEYLDHLILHTQAGQDKPPKVLLMDQHGSHITEEFIIKATDHNIHPFPFPSHLTHVLVYSSRTSIGISRLSSMQQEVSILSTQ
jgi:hypothetical protein